MFFPKEFHNDSVSACVVSSKECSGVLAVRGLDGNSGIRVRVSLALSPLKLNKMKCGLVAFLPVLDQGYDLRVGLPNDALSIYLHYPVPWTELENKLQTYCLLLTATWQVKLRKMIWNPVNKVIDPWNHSGVAPSSRNTCLCLDQKKNTNTCLFEGPHVRIHLHSSFSEDGHLTGREARWV